ncbi:MAG: 30S ribosomal protein S12 methylthiotransferase RimO [Candidatus Omnitrophica bacterium]|nr:30S ribosomal protein S12 methylthiotransferase RimO [Candidatus Omnitrophota bacterium]
MALARTVAPVRRQPTVCLVSLGCARTLVDSELYLGKLVQAGYRVVDSTDQADVAVINTCSFIQDSIQESIDTILQTTELKAQGKLKAVIVAGCLVQRFKGDLIKELPEVDGFVGVDGFGDIDVVVQRAIAGSPLSVVRPRPVTLPQGQAARVALTPSHYAYLKISEGCLKGCAFCIIPKIKGPLASRSIDELVEEATMLVETRGATELVIVGQDTSDYGVDRYGAPRIADLLRALDRVPRLRWMRLLYCHPRGISPQLVEAIRDLPTMCKYLDMAIEHADDDVLRLMNRGITQSELRRTIGELRRAVPTIALRTSVIVGFPGETDAAFANLLAFVTEARFERLGTFRYSPEEGTAAFRAPNQVPEAVRQARYEQLMQVQQEISHELTRARVGQTLDVLIDEADPSDAALFHGRTAADAPEVDGSVYVRSPQVPLAPGRIVPVRMTDAYEYDLAGEAVL